MKALEFKSKVKNNRIYVPKSIWSQLEQDKSIRVIVLMDDDKEDLMFRSAAKSRFFEGYADSDSIYDNC